MCVYPIDVIKSHIQTQPLDRPPLYSSFMDCARKLYQAHGSHIFTRGLLATVLRAFPLNAATFAVYELTMEYLEQHS